MVRCASQMHVQHAQDIGMVQARETTDFCAETSCRLLRFVVKYLHGKELVVGSTPDLPDLAKSTRTKSVLLLVGDHCGGGKSPVGKYRSPGHLAVFDKFEPISRQGGVEGLSEGLNFLSVRAHGRMKGSFI